MQGVQAQPMVPRDVTEPLTIGVPLPDEEDVASRAPLGGGGEKYLYLSLKCLYDGLFG